MAVNVGGGHGALLQAILDRHPHLVGALCDLPHVMAGAYEQRGMGMLVNQGNRERADAEPR